MALRIFNRMPAPFFLGIVFILGFFIRILSGSPAIHTDLVYSPGIRQKPPGTRTPGDTAVSFYMLLDNGQYEQAWELVLEPDFVGTGRVAEFSEQVEADPGDFHGWTDKERFAERMKQELGPGGTGITLKNIRVDSVDLIDFAQYESKHPLQWNLLKESSIQGSLLPRAEGVYFVDVSGSLLGACTIFRWDKQIVVLRIDKEYRLLLSGTKSAKSFFYQSWFSNIEKIGNLRGIQM